MKWAATLLGGGLGGLLGVWAPALGQTPAARDPRLTCTATEIVSFRPLSARLDPPARRVLDQVVAILRDDDGRIAQVDAFADPMAEAAHSTRLSDERARAVETYMRDQGIDTDRVDTFGRGAAIGDKAPAAAADRRVAVVKVCRPEVTSRPAAGGQAAQPRPEEPRP
jgi:outer membrane protein OmpA-like peptidoglycan-associated protein